MREKKLNRLFGARVQQLRRLRGLTQDELAAAIDRSIDTVSNVERGFSSTRLETAANIAKALGVSLPELFEFASSSDKARSHRRELERIMGILSQCPANRLAEVGKIIEQTIQIVGRGRLKLRGEVCLQKAFITAFFTSGILA